MKRLFWVILAACSAPPAVDNRPRIAETLDERTDEDTLVAVYWYGAVDDFDSPREQIHVADLRVVDGGGTVVDGGNGRIHFDPRGAFDSLNQGDTATSTIELTVADADGNTSDAVTFQITIDGKNDAPVARRLTLSVSGNNDASLTLPADADVDDDESTLTATFVHAAGGVPSIANGTITFSPQGAFVALPSGSAQGLQIAYTLVDSHMAASETQGVLDVTVSGTNDVPTAANDAFTVADNRAAELNVLANDGDVDLGDTLTLLSLDGTDVAIAGNRIIYTPSSPASMYQFAYTVSDAYGATSSATVVLTLVPGGSVSTLQSSVPLYVTGAPAPTFTWATSGFTACEVEGTATAASGVTGSLPLVPTQVPSLHCTDAAGEAAFAFPVQFSPAFFVHGSSAVTGPSGLSWDAPFGSIDAAVAAASALGGAHVWIKEGTYTASSGSAPLVQLPANVSLFGGFPSVATGQAGSIANARAAQTVLNGNQLTRVIELSGGSAVIDGFSIVNGRADSTHCGAGVLADGVTDLTLKNVIVSGNGCDSSEDAFGGGVDVYGFTSVTIEDSSFEDNFAIAATGDAMGGGLYVNPDVTGSTSVTLTRVDFTGNIAQGATGAVSGDNGGVGQGGGALLSTAAQMTLSDVIFADNEARGGVSSPSGVGGAAWGGGLSVRTDNATTTELLLEQCVFTGNLARGGAGTPAGGDASGGGALTESLVHITFDATVFNSNHAVGGSGSVTNGSAFAGAFESIETPTGTAGGTGNAP